MKMYRIKVLSCSVIQTLLKFGYQIFHFGSVLFNVRELTSVEKNNIPLTCAFIQGLLFDEDSSRGDCSSITTWRQKGKLMKGQG